MNHAMIAAAAALLILCAVPPLALPAHAAGFESCDCMSKYVRTATPSEVGDCPVYDSVSNGWVPTPLPGYGYTPADGDALVFDGEEGKYKPTPVLGHGFSPARGDALAYNNNTDKYEPAPLPGYGTAPEHGDALVFHGASNTYQPAPLPGYGAEAADGDALVFSAGSGRYEPVPLPGYGTSPAPGDALVFDGDAGKFQPMRVPLVDPDTTPQDGDLMAYDSGRAAWRPLPRDAFVVVEQVDDMVPGMPCDEVGKLRLGAGFTLFACNGTQWGTVGPDAAAPGMDLPTDKIFNTIVSALLRPLHVTELATGNSGQWLAAVVGADGLPVFVYQVSSANELRMARCTTPKCTAATVSTLKASASAFNYLAIAIANGKPAIVYSSGSTQALLLCTDAACSATTEVVMPTSGSRGALAVTNSGRVVVVRTDTSDDWKLVAYVCADTDCSTGTSRTLRASSSLHPSATIGADGKLITAFYDSGTSNLWAAHCDDADCTSVTLNTVDSDMEVGSFTSIAIGTDGLPIISYINDFDFRVRVAHCDDLACSSATISDLHACRRWTSIKIGGDGSPVVACEDSSGHPVVLHCDNIKCTSVHPSTMATVGSANLYTNMIVRQDGMPMAAFYNPNSASVFAVDCRLPGCRTL